MSAKVLVVDDEPDLEGLILQKFRRQIRDGSVSFLFAHGGIEALAMLDENRDVDMVLSDINMPGMDGLSLLAKLQEGDENLSTVIVSAYGDMANIRTAIEPRGIRFRYQADRLRRHPSRGAAPRLYGTPPGSGFNGRASTVPRGTGPGVFEQGDQNEACRSAVSGTPARPALVGPCGTAHPIPHAREKSRTAL